MKSNLKDRLKHNLVPTIENNFHPRFFHIEIFSIFLVLAIALHVFVYSGVVTRIVHTFPALSNIAAVLPALLASETNQYRQLQKVTPLIQNDLLTKAAELKAQDMLDRSYFSHIDPDGNKPWKWIDKVGYQYSYAGENLAIDFIDSKDVTDAWINSITHRANLVNKDFSEIGIGIASGVFENKSTTFVVQFLAKPASNTSPKRVAVNTPVVSRTVSSSISTTTIVAVLSTTTATTTTTTTTATTAATSTNTENENSLASGQVLGLDTKVLDSSTETENNIGKILYSSKTVSLTTIEILIILIVCILLFSISYSIAHHPSLRIIDKIKLTLISHSKVCLYSCIFIAILCMLLIYIVSIKSTVQI